MPPCIHVTDQRRGQAIARLETRTHPLDQPPEPAMSIVGDDRRRLLGPGRGSSACASSWGRPASIDSTTVYVHHTHDDLDQPRSMTTRPVTRSAATISAASAATATAEPGGQPRA